MCGEFFVQVVLSGFDFVDFGHLVHSGLEFREVDFIAYNLAHVFARAVKISHSGIQEVADDEGQQRNPDYSYQQRAFPSDFL